MVTAVDGTMGRQIVECTLFVERALFVELESGVFCGIRKSLTVSKAMVGKPVDVSAETFLTLKSIMSAQQGRTVEIQARNFKSRRAVPTRQMANGAGRAVLVT